MKLFGRTVQKIHLLLLCCVSDKVPPRTSVLNRTYCYHGNHSNSQPCLASLWHGHISISSLLCPLPLQLFLWHICIWLLVHPCMSGSLSGSTQIQEAGFGLGYSLATSMGGPCCSFPAVVFVQFTGLCFSGMSLHAITKAAEPAACFLLQSYISAGFRRETGQKAEKQKKGG